MRNSIILTVSIIALATVALFGGACSAEKPPVVSHGGPTTDYVSLIDNLRQAGATVDPAGEITQPFFSPVGLLITVNGSDVQVFEYETESATEAEAATVSSDGGSVGTTMLAWVAPPHFYQAGRIIVLYVGETQSVLEALEEALGQQFAGR